MVCAEFDTDTVCSCLLSTGVLHVCPTELYPQSIQEIFLVGLGGLEPPTSSLSVTRSNQLSYKPENLFAKILDHCSLKHRNFQG